MLGKSTVYLANFEPITFLEQLRNTYPDQPIIVIMGISMAVPQAKEKSRQYGESFRAFIDLIVELKNKEEFNIIEILFIPTGYLHCYNIIAEQKISEKDPSLPKKPLEEALLQEDFNQEAIAGSRLLDKNWIEEDLPYAKAILDKKGIAVGETPSLEAWGQSQEVINHLTKILQLYKEDDTFKKHINDLTHEKVERSKKNKSPLTEIQKEILLFYSTLYLLKESASAFWFTAIASKLREERLSAIKGAAPVLLTYPSKNPNPAFQYVLDHFTELKGILTYIGYSIKEESLSTLEKEYLGALESAITGIKSSELRGKEVPIQKYLQALVEEIYAQSKEKNAKLNDCNKLTILGLMRLMQLAKEDRIDDKTYAYLGSKITQATIEVINKGTDEIVDQRDATSVIKYWEYPNIRQSLQHASKIEKSCVTYLLAITLSPCTLEDKKEMIESYFGYGSRDAEGIVKKIYKQDKTPCEKITDCYRLISIGLNYFIRSPQQGNKKIGSELNKALSITMIQAVMNGIALGRQHILAPLSSDAGKLNARTQKEGSSFQRLLRLPGLQIFTGSRTPSPGPSRERNPSTPSPRPRD